MMGAPSNERVYKVFGTSRQALRQFQQRQTDLEERLLAAESALLVLRKDHPRLGLKKAYQMIKPAGLGRDRFVRQMTIWGHALDRKRSYTRTTRSSGYRFPNLIKNLVVNDINRIWQSDTTYFYLVDRYVYMTFIIDVYSRLIVGYCASTDLRATANIRALNMALSNRQGMDLSELIFHSDGASQYRSQDFVELLRAASISSSMCEVALDNAYAEKVNDVIKNEYLSAYQLTTMEQLRYRLKRAVANYNEVRIHGQLPIKLAPADYERYLSHSHDYTTRTALWIREGQGERQEYEPRAVQDLRDDAATWVASGVITQILPAFVTLNLQKQNGQLALDF
jgi:transposase InsO family protein